MTADDTTMNSSIPCPGKLAEQSLNIAESDDAVAAMEATSDLDPADETAVSDETGSRDEASTQCASSTGGSQDGDSHVDAVSKAEEATKDAEDGAKRPAPVIDFSVERQVYTQPVFDKGYDEVGRPTKTCKEQCASCRDKCQCSGRCWYKKTVSFFPFLRIMRKYSSSDLFYDCVAGLTVSVLQIPQGMAYAMLANVDPVYGLYTSFFSVIIYFFFGTSKHVNVGTFAVVSLMVGSAVDKVCAGEDDGSGGEYWTTYSPANLTTMMGLSTSAYTESFNGTDRPGGGGSDSSADCNILAATAVTFVSGCTQLLLGISRLGMVVIYLSEPLTRGFTTGAAIHVFTSQLKYIFGVEVGSYNGAWKLIYTYRDLFLALPDTNWFAFTLACVCMIILWVTKEYINPRVKKYTKAPIPIELIVVILAVIGCYFGDWEEKHGVEIVGDIPTGLPSPSFPPTSYMAEVIGDGIAIAIVAFAISVSMAQTFASKHNYKIDPNQELVAHGIANVFGANFYCYTTCVSLSRSVVQENLGNKTQVSGLFSCGILLLVLLWLAPLFEPLPECVLGAIVIVALKGMFLQFADLKKLWYISGTDLSVWLVTFTAVCLFDVAWGLVIGVAWALLTVVGRTQGPYCCLEGRVADTDIYKDLGVYQKAQEIPGIKIFRMDSSLYFANTRHFQKKVYKKTGCNPQKLTIAQTKVDDKRALAEKKQRKYDKDLAKSMEKGKSPPKTDVLDFIEEVGRLERPVPNIHTVIIDCTTMGFVDAQGVNYMASVIRDYTAVDVKVLLAGCKADVRAILESGGLYRKYNRRCLYPTVHDAVLASLEGYPEVQDQVRYVSSEALPPPEDSDSDSDTDSGSDNDSQDPDGDDIPIKVVINSHDDSVEMKEQIALDSATRL